MSAPKSPQDALRVQRVLIATLWVSLAVTVILAVVVLINTPTIGWSLTVGLLGMIGMYAVLFSGMVKPAGSAADNFRQHSVEDGGHHCQCRDCGRTFTPAPGSPTQPVRATATPQQRGAAARSMIRISPIAGMVLLIALIAAVVIDVIGKESQTGGFPLVYTVGLVLANAVGLLIIVVVARAQRNAMDRKIGSHLPQHGCTCSWCGRSGSASSRP